MIILHTTVFLIIIASVSVSLCHRLLIQPAYVIIVTSVLLWYWTESVHTSLTTLSKLILHGKKMKKLNLIMIIKCNCWLRLIINNTTQRTEPIPDFSNRRSIGIFRFIPGFSNHPIELGIRYPIQVYTAMDTISGELGQ